jgi:hypothetical protein
VPKRKLAKLNDPPGTLLLDDRWLNQVEDWLAATAAFCERELGRKPAIEDLQALLSTVLTAGSVGEWLSDGDRRIVTKVIFETAPRPAVPKKLQAGHLFAIPLGKRLFAFGRIMLMQTPWLVGSVAEIFRLSRPTRVCDRAVLASGRLFRPLEIHPVSSIETGRWPVVGLDSAYRVRKEDKLLEFSGAPSGNFTAILPFAGGRDGRLGRRLTTDEMSELVEATEGDHRVLEPRIRRELKRVRG